MGLEPQLIGAEGSQIDCFTVVKTDYVPAKLPWGGGFALQNYTLKYLYSENEYHNNIWTASNKLKAYADIQGVTLSYLDMTHKTLYFI